MEWGACRDQRLKPLATVVRPAGGRRAVRGPDVMGLRFAGEIGEEVEEDGWVGSRD